MRYYLGLLLAWTGQRDAAITQFKKAVALGPTTELGKAAGEFLARCTAGWDQAVDQMSRSAYARPSDAAATVPASLGRRAQSERGGGRGRG